MVTRDVLVVYFAWKVNSEQSEQSESKILSKNFFLDTVKWKVNRNFHWGREFFINIPFTVIQWWDKSLCGISSLTYPPFNYGYFRRWFPGGETPVRGVSPSGIERDSRGYRAAGRAGVVAVRVVCVSAAPAVVVLLLAGVILALCPSLHKQSASNLEWRDGLS